MDRRARSDLYQRSRRLARRSGTTEAVELFNVLTSEELLDTTEALLSEHRERLYPPTVTLSMFMRQTLEADGSCQKAVNGWAAQRAADGLRACSVRTGAYCRARQRLPLQMVSGLARHTGGLLSEKAHARWLWRGRAVKLVDGTGLSMPDTRENQAVYPQPGSQSRGVGFPLARLVMVICLATGAALDAAIGPHQGKGSGELGLVRQVSLAWKQQVIVDNRPGASEVIAAQVTIAARNDGYTLLFCTETPLSLNPFTFSRLSYDPDKDLAPVSLIVTAPLVLVVPQNSPAKSVEDFVRIARSRAASKPMTYGSAGAGGVLQLPMVMLSRNHQLDLVHVPYKGAAPLLQDLIGGQIDAAWVGVSGAVPFVRDGRVKALVVGGDKRLSALPDTPVFSETKVPAERADFMFAIVAPAGTPEDVQNKISASIHAVVHDPAFIESQLDPFGYVPIGSTPTAFRSFLVKDRPVQEQRVKLSGVRLD